ncbi:MAG: glycosyltransferase family 39 protein, partial [Chloroflexota bacterium]
MNALTRRDLFLLACVTALAFGLRLYRLDSLPPGLHHDEALNGIEARELLTTGARPIYIGSGFNGEPLLEYSMMVSEAVFGVTPFAVRLPSALVGALTIPIVFMLVRVIGSWRVDVRHWNGAHAPTSTFHLPPSSFQPLISSVILATLYWHLNASREGYKPVLLPLFGALAFYFLFSTFSSSTVRRLPSAVACGLVLGLGFYTYPSIRFLYPVVALLVVFVMWRDRARAKTYFVHALLMAVIALLVFAPLGVYYWQHPGAFFTRSDQVSV